jgi:hypothetical protein
MDKVYKSTKHNLKDIDQEITKYDILDNNNFNLLDNEIDILNLLDNDINDLNNIEILNNEIFLKELDQKFELSNNVVYKNEEIREIRKLRNEELNNDHNNFLIDDDIYKMLNKTSETDSNILQNKKTKLIYKLVNNQKEGKARQIYSNGDILKFNYKNDKRNGKAMLAMKDGIINFNYKNDKKYGLSKIIMLNGSTMTFNFNNDIIEGDAIIKKSSGEIIKLVYKNGKLYK